MPNTSCMIYMIPPANFHNPNSFNSSCTLSIAVEEERAAVAEESVKAVTEVISPIASRRSHPAQFGEDRFGPPSLERSGSEHREGAVTSPLPEVSVPRKRGNRRGVKTIERGLGRKWSPLWLKRDGVIRKNHYSKIHLNHIYSSCQFIQATTLLISPLYPRQYFRKAKKAVISFIQLLIFIKLLILSHHFTP